MITCIVVERETDKRLLELLLPFNLRQHIVIVSAGGASPAQALAGSMLLTRSNSVILLVNTNTEETAVIDRQRAAVLQNLNSMAPADAVFRVVEAVPSLEIVLVDDRDILEQRAGKPLSDDEWLQARQQSYAYFQLAIRTEYANFAAHLPSALLSRIRQHPLLVAISQFIEQNISANHAS